MLDSMETAAARQSDWKVIQLDNLSVHFDNGRGNQAEVLRDISLDIYEGEFVCLLGASGCGKSTLLKVVAGLIEPTDGQAMLDGEPITGPDWQRGVVFQQPPLYPWLTVEQNIAFGPRMRHMPRAQRQQLTKAYLDKVNLSAFDKHKTYALSGGMRQRVAIARALINNPRILLMDEPFGALDALTREQMQALVRSLWADTHKTILFITHDVDEALALGTRVLVMSRDSGRIERDMRVEFTYSIAGDTADNTRFTKAFQAAREEILAIINGQTPAFQI